MPFLNVQNKLWCFLFLVLFLSKAEILAQSSALFDRFENCTGSITAPWITFSVSGNQQWDCNASGFQNNCASMNGYANSTNYVNEDWLITPLLDLHSYYNPRLELEARTKYQGAGLQLYYSTNYSGSGNPNAATWNQLSIALPPLNSDVWTRCTFSLNPLKNTPCYLAFKYSSSSTAAASWKLDNIQITDSCTTRFMNCGDVAPGTNGLARPFQFIKSEIVGNLTLNTTAPFEISKNNSSFSSTLTYSSSDQNVLQTVYFRMSPLIGNKVFRGRVNFNYDNQTQGTNILLVGSSIDSSKSIKMASWNMRWFGYPAMCSCDTALAKQQAFQVLKHLDADIYALEEVVEISQIRDLCAQLGPTYQCVFSNFASFANDSNDSQFGTAQKLGFIYNTQKINLLQSFGLLKSTYPANSNPYYCFSSGRFPFVMKASVQLGQVIDTVVFVGIHAKASSTLSDYQRRECGTQFMTDSLNTLFPSDIIFILGDYNDFLEGSTVSGQNISPYNYLLDQGFQGISLPSLYPSITTFSGTENYLIDNISCSNEALNYYVDSSFTVLREMEDVVPDYAATTSDHFPIVAYAQFNYPNNLEITQENNPGYRLVSPSTNTLTLRTEAETNNPVTIEILGLDGHRLHTVTTHAAKEIKIDCSELKPGLYIIRLKENNQPVFFKWLVTS